MANRPFAGRGRSARHCLAFTGSAAVLATTAFSLHAAEIVAPTHNVKITYQDASWAPVVNGRSVEFKCTADACGGTTAECDVTAAPIKGGLSRKAFFDAFSREFAHGILKRLSEAGIRAKVVDPPTSYMVGDRIAELSSVRYDEAGTPVRQWLMQMDAPFGVVAMVCYGDEVKFDAAKPQWILLANGISVQ